MEKHRLLSLKFNEYYQQHGTDLILVVLIYILV